MSKQGGWIDAGRKWPDRIGCYLIVVDGVVLVAVWMGGGIWLHDGSAVTATHWQSLPLPPQEASNDD